MFGAFIRETGRQILKLKIRVEIEAGNGGNYQLSGLLGSKGFREINTF